MGNLVGLQLEIFLMYFLPNPLEIWSEVGHYALKLAAEAIGVVLEEL